MPSQYQLERTDAGDRSGTRSSPSPRRPQRPCPNAWEPRRSPSDGMQPAHQSRWTWTTARTSGRCRSSRNRDRLGTQAPVEPGMENHVRTRTAALLAHAPPALASALPCSTGEAWMARTRSNRWTARIRVEPTSCQNVGTILQGSQTARRKQYLRLAAPTQASQADCRFPPAPGSRPPHQSCPPR